MRKITVSDLVDYLGQFRGDLPVVISMDDLGADATEEDENAVSLTTAMEVLLDG